MDEEFLTFLNEVDPVIEARKAMWNAISAWCDTANIDQNRRTFIEYAIKHSSGIAEDAEPRMRNALEALLHPSAFAERDFLL